MLRNVAFLDELIGVVMDLIRRSHYRLLWNGEVTDIIHSTRVLKQGDPSLSYLSMLCMERLGHWIHSKVAEGTWRPMQDSRGGNRVSHLFFADDLMLFV